MRIQHNIMALNAYRNYNTNTTALSKNLEKLSSGYKINRAGDDAAGLAISEKMRAQITGLDAAAKNVKDGISLVKTAEGAMQEVQDMLNRMVDLATQSANGTYQDEVDREALQAEIDQLNSEIDRIADSANFNGIKLLDGSLDGGGISKKIDGLDRILADDTGSSVADVGHKTILDGGVQMENKNTVFEMDFTGLSGAGGSGAAAVDVTPEVKDANPGDAATKASATVALKFDADNTQTITVGDKTFQINPAPKTAGAAPAATVSFSGTGTEGDPFTYTRTGNESDADITAGIAAALSSGVTIGDTKFDVTAEGTTLVLTAAAEGAVKSADGSKELTAEEFTAEVEKAVTSSVASSGGDDQTTPSTGVNVSVKGGTAAKAAAPAKAEITVSLKDSGGNAVTLGDSESVTIKTAGTDGANALNLTATYTASSTSWSVSGAPSGYNATFDGTTLTMTATADGAKDLETADFGAVSITSTNSSVDTTESSATLNFTDGNAEVTAVAGTAEATIKAADLTSGATIKVGDKSLKLTDELLTDPSKITAELNKLNPTGFTVNATASNGDISITLTEASGQEGKNTDAQLKTSIGLEKAPDSGNNGGGAGTSSAVAAAEIPAYNPATAAADDKITFDVKLGDQVLAKGVEVEAGATAEAITAAVMKKLEETADADTTLDGYQVKIGETTYTVEDKKGKLEFTLADDPTESNIKGNFDWNIENIEGGAINGNHTGGTTVTTPGAVDKAGKIANTVFNVTADDITDGTKITILDKTVTLAVGVDSTLKGDNVVDLRHLDPTKEGGITADELNDALSRISEKFSGKVGNLIVGVNDTKNGQNWTGLTVKRDPDAKGDIYSTKEDLAAVFSINHKSVRTDDGLTLQIGDTSESFNQLTVSIGDIHADALGIGGLSIATQKDAAAAINKIKAAINQVSSIRGTLGATQNRLEHTQNNLSVMAENIQDAESTIRDTDVAEEMMSYVKNNILVQSAQAMLAQANQVPQGVLQLLG